MAETHHVCEACAHLPAPDQICATCGEEGHVQCWEAPDAIAEAFQLVNSMREVLGG